MIKYIILAMAISSCATTQYVPSKPIYPDITPCLPLEIPTADNWLQVIKDNAEAYYLCKAQVDMMIEFMKEQGND